MIDYHRCPRAPPTRSHMPPNLVGKGPGFVARDGDSHFCRNSFRPCLSFRLWKGKMGISLTSDHACSPTRTMGWTASRRVLKKHSTPGVPAIARIRLSTEPMRSTPSSMRDPHRRRGNRGSSREKRSSTCAPLSPNSGADAVPPFTRTHRNAVHGPGVSNETESSGPPQRRRADFPQSLTFGTSIASRNPPR